MALNMMLSKKLWCGTNELELRVWETYMLRSGGRGGGIGKGGVNINLFTVSSNLFRLMKVSSNIPKVQ
tara:strand:+ start:1043 stop:1246 length:204 start_codon:yes stop_codon:yes gene_type:complete